MPPAYEEIDEDSDNRILDTLELSNYDDVEKQLNQTEMTPKKREKYLDHKLKKAIKKRNQLKGQKSHVSKTFNQGEIKEEEKKKKYKTFDKSIAVLNRFIKHYQNKLQFEGSGIKKRGGNIIFYNNAKQLLKELELIIGEILAGNTSIKMRNTGVAILNILLETTKINKAQHEKLYKTYFKV